MDHIDIKYLNLLSPRLDKFKQKKNNLWNFRCPICGDSDRNKNKARGFVFELKGDLVYKCHNCGLSLPLGKLVEKMDPVLYKQYRLEKFKKPNKPKVDMRKVKKVVSTTPTFKNVREYSDLIPISKLNTSHPAREYLLNRRLPTEALYYTEKFKEWTNSVKPDTFQDTTNDEGRIIIPFKDREGNLFGFQGRSLSPTGLRYITILLQEDKPKIFGLDKINYESTVYVTEGPFDSLFLENSIAMAGADLSDLGDHISDLVFIYDNEPRNTQICDRIQHHISRGDKVVIWPYNIKEKDINDMILKGIPVSDLVKTHTYSGLTATLKYNEWKK